MCSENFIATKNVFKNVQESDRTCFNILMAIENVFRKVVECVAK